MRADRVRRARRPRAARLPDDSRPAREPAGLPRSSSTCTAALGTATSGGTTRRRSGSPTAGYACLQVNFRGSTGYGKDSSTPANSEWGGRMHDDLVDAVQWAVDRGIADPDRVAIYGGSYGGYAALAGATFTPDLFRCAVDIVGPEQPDHVHRDDPALLVELPRDAARIGSAIPRPRPSSCGRARRSRTSTGSGSRCSSPRAPTIRA